LCFVKGCFYHLTNIFSGNGFFDVSNSVEKEILYKMGAAKISGHFAATL